METGKWPLLAVLALALAAAVAAQETPSVSVHDDLPVGAPVKPGTIEPAEPATATEAPPPATPDPAAAPAVPETPPSAAAKPKTPEMAYTGFEVVPWMLGSAAIVFMGVALLYWSRRAPRRS